MACRGCSSDGCACSVTGTSPISVTGSGTPISDPYIVTFDFEDALGAVTVDDATDCTLLNDPHVPVLLGDGTAIMVPLPCYAGLDEPVPGNAFAFTWNSATGTDPGAGYIAFDNAAVASATTVYVSNTETEGTDVQAWMESIGSIVGSPIGTLKIYSRTDPTAWVSFNVTAVAAGVAGVTNFTVNYVGHSGALSDAIIGDIVLDITPAAEGSVGGFDSVQAIRSVVGADSLVLTDAGKYLRCANAAPFSLTVPANATVAFTVGTHVDLIQSGAGQVTVAAAGGVTINATPGLKLNGQWAGATLVKVGTNEWDLVGNLSA